MSSPRVVPGPAPVELVTPTGLVRHAFAAMGTQMTLLLPSDRISEGARVERLVATWDETCTRFDPHSELSRLNAAQGEPRTVSPLLFGVLAYAYRAAQATDGLFDPTLLPSLEAIGYDRDFEAIAGGLAARTWTGRPPATGGWRAMELHPDRQIVRLPMGVRVDLGGLAKGMAVDAVIADLASRDVVVAAIDAGGDLAVIGRPPGAAAWTIAIEAPEGVRTVTLDAGALATSSTSRRRWRQGSEERHHLIDPRTGLPSTAALWSASVAAGTCAQAEVAAKAAFLLGPEAGAQFLVSHDLSGLFLAPDGTESRAGRWLAA